MKIRSSINLLAPTSTQRVLLHSLFWLLLFGLRAYLTFISFNVYSGFPTRVLLLLNLSGVSLIATAFYIFTGPVFALAANRKKLLVVLSVLATLFLYTFLDAALEQLIVRSCKSCLSILEQRQPGYYGLLQSGFINIVLKRLLSLGTPFFLLLTLSIPLCIKLALAGWRSQVKALELAKSNIELEFNFLKSQVNPHFLFNTLNNIYGLILREETQRSAALVAQLSALLRYMLYEANQSRQALDRELGLLQDYIELEKARLNQTAVTTHIHTDSMEYLLPPLLLMPVIENAFKFCSDEEGAYIRFNLDVQQGQLRVMLDNTVNAEITARTGAGIGLPNFRKRLELYYPERYRYETTLKDGIYAVVLSIDIL